MGEASGTRRVGPATPGARAGLVWAAALVVYAVAVANRTSFGVAGLAAAHRFGANATTLSLFAVIQVIVYAVLQLPVGVALDRWGSRRMLAVGAVTMAAGQLAMALAGSVPAALAARVLIGGGDAMTFVSAVRLVPAWFPARRVPLLTQLTGIVGQLGQVVSAVPFAFVLLGAGWSPAFGALAGLGLVAAVVGFTLVRDRPADGPRLVVPTISMTAGLSATLRSPGTWLGFWAHLVSAYSLHVFTLMWGYPFLVEAQGLTPAQAGSLLTLSVLVAIVAGPVIGELTARHRDKRLVIVLVVAGCTLAGWAIALLPSTPRPLWQLAVFVALISLGGPTSLVGLDYAASSSPPERMGSATGVANAGAFVGAVVVMLGVGAILDHRATGAASGLPDFRVALSLVPVAWVVAVGGLLLTAARVRRNRTPGT